TGQDSETFLDEFAARPAGVMVATASLLGEGYDDSTINAAVVTYPTESMLQLMQVAGRSMRSAPSKTEALVVQVRDSALAYHWEQRWLYQDISDLLRPRLADRSYSSLEHLVDEIEDVLTSRNVPEPIAQQVRAELSTVTQGERISLLLTGLPYDGAPDEFESS